MKKKRDAHYTIAITPERWGRTRYFVVRRRGLRLALAGVTVVVLAIVGFGVAGLNGLWEAQQSAIGADRSEALRLQLEAAEAKMQVMAQRLERIGQLEDRLRELAQISDPGRRLAIGPVDTPDGTEQSAWGNREHPLLAQARETLIADRMDGLLDEAAHQTEQLDALVHHFEAMEARLASTPALRPAKGWLTSRFGERRDPMTGRTTMHEGIDVAASIGTPIIAPADAEVVRVGDQNGYGLVVVLDHGFGMMTKYAHLADSPVRAGDRVRRGDRIGSIGMSGRSTGPHLHYEVLVDGIAADPEYFILD